tara:strand:- start:927 stop:1184 length:258 start_codon:yes stop_codon:yes gene_type:complete
MNKLLKKTMKKKIIKSIKNKKGGKIIKRVKKFTSKRKGGFLDTIINAIVPFGLVATNHVFKKKMKKKSNTLRRTFRKTFRKTSKK